MDMPNQRDSRKKMLGVYLTEEELSDLRRIAKLKGLNLTEVVKQFIAEYVEKKNENHDN